MKKLLSLLAIMGLLISFGCESGKKDETKKEETKKEETKKEETKKEETPPAPKE